LAGGTAPKDALALLRQALSQDSRFRLLGPGEQPPEGSTPARLVLSVDLEEDEEGAVLDARVVARRTMGGDPVRVDSVAQATLPVLGVESRAQAVHDALVRTLSDAREQTAAQLAALDTADAVLEKQLKDRDPIRREAALKILTLRRHPAAVPIWIQRLEAPDPSTVREAIGALVDLGDPRAVPALIELARKKDTGFLREIIFALESIGGDEAGGYLYTMAQGHDEPRVREAAQAAWEALEARQKEHR
jgi:HEAT repeat protein